MTYISIDTKEKQAKLFLEYVRTLSFVTVHQVPNEQTKKGIDEAKNGKSKQHKNAKDLITFLKG